MGCVWITLLGRVVYSKYMNSEERERHLPYYERATRPWGTFERFTLNQPSTVKIVTVKPGCVLSLQTHAHRSEFWHIVAGEGYAVIDGARREARAGDEFFVSKGAPHRIGAGSQELVFLEIALGDFDEEDVVRIDDAYGRA